MTKLGIITGLAFEAKLLERSGHFVRCAGVTPHAGQRASQALVERGATALMSFGIAGGLDPQLRSGTIIVTSDVRAGMLPTVQGNEAWAAELRTRIPGARNAPLAHVASILTTTADKAALFGVTGAAAADMESYGVAEIASTYKLPFVAVRVIADRADDAVPAVAADGVTAEGRVRLFASVVGALLHPRQIPDLMHLGRQTAVARAELRRIAARAGELLGSLG